MMTRTRSRLPWLFLMLSVPACISLIPVSEGCILASDGWTPMSVENRTLQAQVVLAGTVVELRGRAPGVTPHGGVYSAEVSVDEVYKGYPFFNKVLPLTTDSDSGNIYLIRGFGSRDKCLSQVRANQKYIMFLTTVPVSSGREEDGMRLLARYDDIFGAVVEFSPEEEKMVHNGVGWKPWAPWTSCSATCGGGVQLRRRMCVQDVADACEGAAEQTRQCNAFACQGVKDLLQLMSLSSFPPGVRRSPRRKAYHIGSNAVLKLPLSSVYPSGFPDEFSILLVVKPPRYFPNLQNGYLYAMLVTGPDGGVQLGVQLSSSPALVYGRSGSTGKVRPHAVTFTEHALDKRGWNALAFSVKRDSVTLYADCTEVYRVDLDKDTQIRIGSGSGEISIGNPKPNMIDMYFEGDLEQLMLIDDPNAASLQCLAPSGTFPSESAWPSINITTDLQGDMDIPLNVPIPGSKRNPPITLKDALTTTNQPPNQESPNDETANEQELVPSSPQITTNLVTTPPAFYNENNFDFAVDVFDINQIPGGILSSPIPKKPQNINSDVGNEIIVVPGVKPDEVPTTPSETKAEDNFKPDTNLEVDNEISQTTQISSTDKFTQTETELRTTTTVTSTPTTKVPLPKLATTTTELPTSVPTTVPVTTRASRESSTAKLRLEGAHRPDHFETGFVAFNPQLGNTEDEKDKVLENWSTWSTCSRTCGTGTRYRYSHCRPGSRLRDCKTGRGIAAQTQTCHLDDCRVPSLKWSAWSTCSRTCGDGVEMRMAYCYDNDVPGCDNGRKTVVERRLCRRRHCFDVCKPSCKNGGVCRTDRTCDCLSGYLGPSCEIVLCSQPCQNGGECVAKNYCTCPNGYAPPRCTPICNPRCQNGGTCKAPFECACSPGFTGLTCAKTACIRPCQNGGTCTGPNQCSCLPGYQGSHCEEAVCSPTCENGGTCVRPGFCRCPPAYRGRTCHIAYCRVTCRNGGRCSGPDTCTCAAGFGGTFCQRRYNTPSHVSTGNQPNNLFPSNFAQTRTSKSRKRQCRLRSVLISYQRSYVKPVAKTVQVQCGYWHKLLCTQTRMTYETAYKTFYRMAYRRQCGSDES